MKKKWMVIGLVVLAIVMLISIKSLPEKTSVKAEQTKEEDLQLPSKEELQNKMINSIDYFQTASVSFDMYSKKDQERTHVEGEVDLKNHRSNVQMTTKKNGKVNDELTTEEDPSAYLETYPTEKAYRLDRNEEKLTDEDYAEAQRDFKEDCPTVSSRYSTYQGQLQVDYRPAPANLAAASEVLFAQETALGFLKDYSQWRIDGREKLLDRDVIRVSGSLSKDYQDKLGATTFTLWIDEKTGAMLKYEGYDNQQEVVDYTHTEAIQFDQTKTKKMLKSQTITPPKGYHALDLPTK